MSRLVEKRGSPSSSQDDELVPDAKGSKKTRDMLVGFPIFASAINKQLIEGIMKNDKKDRLAPLCDQTQEAEAEAEVQDYD